MLFMRNALENFKRDLGMAAIALLLIVLAVAPRTAHADLWAYVDPQGRSHLANHQVDARYTLFFKGPTTTARMRLQRYRERGFINEPWTSASRAASRR